jgi:CBS domain-containing protein
MSNSFSMGSTSKATDEPRAGRRIRLSSTADAQILRLRAPVARPRDRSLLELLPLGEVRPMQVMTTMSESSATTWVDDVMTTRLHTCKRGETLERAAKIMWEHGCAEVPVVDDDGFLVTMVSDRSALLCAYTQGKPLGQIAVTSAAPRTFRVARAGDSLDAALELMRKHHERCLPVVDAVGRLIGVVSITDIIRATSLQEEPRLSASSINGLPRHAPVT